MKKNHTEIVCIIDRSGSMMTIKDDAIGGFNAFLEEQRKVEGTAAVTLILFDDEYTPVYGNIDLKEVKNLDDATFVPRGTTALTDAIGKTVNDVGQRLALTQESDRPEKVIVCILTDGAENASKEYSLKTVKEMIEHQKEKYNWEFAFLSADLNAAFTAKGLGIAAQNTVLYAATSIGTRSAYDQMSDMTRTFRSKRD